MYTQQQYQSVSYPQQKPTIQKLLDDNTQLITFILDSQAKGRQMEGLEYQRTLHRNLSYLTQFDPTTAHYPNNLPPPDSFIQTQSSAMNENIIQQTQSDQIYRTHTNCPTPLNTLNQTPRNPNSSVNISSTSLIQQQQQQHSYSMYHPQQQWQNQSRVPMQQQRYESSYQQPLPPRT